MQRLVDRQLVRFIFDIFNVYLGVESTDRLFFINKCCFIF